MLIKGLEIEDVSVRYLFSLLSLCPNLKILSLVGNGGSAIQINSIFFEKLFEIQNVSKLRRLEMGSENDKITARYTLFHQIVVSIQFLSVTLIVLAVLRN